jgi:starvation-inducible DNA-binding protein
MATSSKSSKSAAGRGLGREAADRPAASPSPRPPRGEDAPAGDGRTADRPLPIGLSHEVRQASVALLNQLLADTMTLRDLYKKHHWQVAGPTFYQLHLLFDKHYTEQSELVDEIAERVRILGGISVAMAADVAETTQIPRPPIGREPPRAQIERLLQAHEIVLVACHAAAKEAGENGDDGTNDLIVSSVIRTNEMQVWFAGEHLVHLPLDGASAGGGSADV